MKRISEKELIDKRFNRLIITQELEPRIKPNGYPGGEKVRRFLCKCDCGNECVAVLRDIKSGNTKSCGCFSNENRYKHGLTKHPLHKRWIGIKQRCYNKNAVRYSDWGGRGITMCDEWKNNFESFYNWALSHGYKKELHIDRINNDGNYSPENCRFVTIAENNKNQRVRKDSRRVA